MTIQADLEISVTVNCPSCNTELNLMDDMDTDGVYLNDDAHIIKQACPSNGNWIDEHKKFKVENVTCSHCKHQFDVNGLLWQG